MTIDQFITDTKCTPSEAKEVKLYLLFLRWVRECRKLLT